VILVLTLVSIVTQSAPISDEPDWDAGEDYEARPKRPDWLSVNRDLASIAAMMRQMKSDRVHSALVDIGKRDENLLHMLYRYQLFNNMLKDIRPAKKSQLSVDMPLSAISNMLSGQRIRNNQRQVHSQLLKIGKRDIHDVMDS
jgi:hypothetical protein